MYLNDTPIKKSWRSSFKKRLLAFVYKSGLVRLGRGLWANTITVLNYHRIDDPDREDFDTFRPNVSARPKDFDSQMEYIAREFNIVSLNDVADWLDEKRNLPPHAALITFDDGYLDNYTNAYPILRKYNFPAVIFLTTRHIQQDIPFYWDLLAYCFHHTLRDHIVLPDNTHLHWQNSIELGKASRNLIEHLKSLSESEKSAWVEKLPNLLDVSIPTGHFRTLMVDWDQVREMHQGGIEFGGHTMSHPILTRVPIERAREEIEGSKAHIEQELGEAILGFAYPNGLTNDFNSEIESLTAQAGFRVAFTLLNGPSTQREVKRNPFSIRRVFISHKHTLPEFTVLVSGFNRYRPS